MFKHQLKLLLLLLFILNLSSCSSSLLDSENALSLSSTKLKVVSITDYYPTKSSQLKLYKRFLAKRKEMTYNHFINSNDLNFKDKSLFKILYKLGCANSMKIDPNYIIKELRKEYASIKVVSIREIDDFVLTDYNYLCAISDYITNQFKLGTKKYSPVVNNYFIYIMRRLNYKGYFHTISKERKDQIIDYFLDPYKDNKFLYFLHDISFHLTPHQKDKLYNMMAFKSYIFSDSYENVFSELSGEKHIKYAFELAEEAIEELKFNLGKVKVKDFIDFLENNFEESKLNLTTTTQT